MERNLICIICPRGCNLKADQSGSEIRITGNACPRGEEYAIRECTAPVRTVTAVVRVANRNNTMVSVKTETPVSKESMMDVMAHLHSLRVNAPVKIGQVISAAFGTNIIITKAVD